LHLQIIAANAAREFCTEAFASTNQCKFWTMVTFHHSLFGGYGIVRINTMNNSHEFVKNGKPARILRLAREWANRKF
jgi:hypothetical protein